MTDDIKPQEETPIGEEVHNKSFAELAEEARQEQIESLVPPVEEPKVETTPATDPAEEQRKAQEAQAAREAEIARKAAEEALKAREDEEKKKELESRAEEEKAKREAALKPAWQNDPNRPKDDQGNPLPQSYDEIVAEAARIGKEQALAEIRAEQDRIRQEQDNQQQTEKQQQELLKAREDYLNKQIDEDLTDMYDKGLLPRIQNENDPNDEGVRARNELFKAGAIANQERMAKGLPPVSSLKLIYMDYYKAPTKPAGASAPVAGNTPPASAEPSADEYDYARDHAKPMSVVLAEEKERLARANRG